MKATSTEEIEFGLEIYRFSLWVEMCRILRSGRWSPTGYCSGSDAVGAAGLWGQHLLHQAPGHWSQLVFPFHGQCMDKKKKYKCEHFTPKYRKGIVFSFANQYFFF